MSTTTSRLTVTSDTNTKKVNVAPRGNFNVDSLSFSNGAVMASGTNIDLDCPFDTHMISSISGNITADCNIQVTGTLKTNYLAPVTEPCVTFQAPVAVDCIKERNIGEGVSIDGALIKDGEFYANGSDKVETQCNRNVPNGYVSLDANGKFPISLLPSGTIRLVGAWNAATNSPALAAGAVGDARLVTVAGEDWNVGDLVMYDGTTWVRLPNVGSVQSVNGQTGAVTLGTADISEGTNLFLTTDRINANTNVAADFLHVSQVSGNVHNLTASQVGNDVAQWNANQLMGREISAVAPVEGDYLAWDSGESAWGPTGLPDTPAPPKLISTTFDSKGVISVNNGSTIEVGRWTFPTNGNYRIVWGTVCDYNAAANNVGQLILSINGSGVSTLDLNTYGGQHCEMKSVWYQNVTAGTVGRLLATNTSGNGMTLSGYFVSVDRW